MSARFFITGTGTGVGKTLLTTTLAHQLRLQGHAVTALKPVISGFHEDNPDSDTALILRSLGKPVTPENIAAISPWRYRLPLSADMAARKEGREVPVDAVADYCRAAQGELVLVEGIGGVMSPLGRAYTVRDLAVALGWPVICVAGTYLGSLSHTLTAIAALPPHALVISESDSGVPVEEVIQSLRLIVPPRLPVYILPRITAGGDAWRHVPPMTQLCRI